MPGNSQDASPLAPFLAGLITSGRDWMAKQPPWVHVVAVVLSMVFGALTHKTCTHAPTPVNVAITAPAVTPSPEPVQQFGAPPPVERGPARQKFVADAMRAKVAHELQANGFKLAGGNATPLDADAADRLAARLSDATVLEAGKSIGAVEQIGEGTGRPLLDFIRSIFAWIREHPDEIIAWLKLLLSFLMFL